MTTDTLDMEIQRVEASRIHEVDFDNLVFGRHYSDHMFVADYIDGEWTNLQIVPYANLSPVSYTHLDVYKRQFLFHYLSLKFSVSILVQ